MNARTPKAVHPKAASSATILLAELEMPNSTAFDAFEERFDVQLAKLEERFRDYVTRNSLAGSIGR